MTEDKMKEGERLRSWEGEKKSVIRYPITIRPLTFILLPYTLHRKPYACPFESRTS